MRREMQWYTLGLQCWITRLTAWLYTVRKRDTFQSSLACSPDWSVLTVSMQGSGPGSPLHAMLTSVCTPRPPPVQCLLSWGPSVRFSLPTPLAAFAWPSRFCFSSCCSAAVLAPFDLASAVSPSLRPRFEASSPGVRGSAATALCFWRTTALPRSRQPSPAPWNRLRSPYYAHARRAASPLRWLEVSSLATVTPLKPFFYPWRPWLGSCPILGVPSASVVMLAYRATHGWMQNCLALLGSEGHFIPSSPSLLLHMGKRSRATGSRARRGMEDGSSDDLRRELDREAEALLASTEQETTGGGVHDDGRGSSGRDPGTSSPCAGQCPQSPAEGHRACGATPTRGSLQAPASGYSVERCPQGQGNTKARNGGIFGLAGRCS